MSINFEEALGIEEYGIVAKDADGNILYYLTGGSGEPLGQAAPVPTLYIQEEDATLWTKVGPGNNDWKKIGTDRNLDGGFANAVFKPSECFDGGDANG